MAAALLATKGSARPATPADTAAADPAAQRKAANGNGLSSHLAAVEGGLQPEPASHATEPRGDGETSPAASLTSAHFLRPRRAPRPEAAPAAGEPGEAPPAGPETNAVAGAVAGAEAGAEDPAAAPQILEPLSLGPAESLEAVEPSLSAIEESVEPELPPAAPETPEEVTADDAISADSPAETAAPMALGPVTAGAEPATVMTPGLKSPGSATPAAGPKAAGTAPLDAGALGPTVAALNAYGARSTGAGATPSAPARSARREQRRNKGTLVALVALGAVLAVGVGWYSTNLPAPEGTPIERLKDAVGAAQQKDQAAPPETSAAQASPRGTARPEFAPMEAVTGNGADYLPSAALGAEAPQQAAVAPAEPVAEPVSAPAAEPAPAPTAPAVDVVRIEAGSAVIAGTGAPGSALIVLDKGEPIGTAQVDGNGQWVLIPDVVLAEGDHEISLVVKDEQATVRIPKKQ